MSETTNLFNPDALDANFFDENSGQALASALDPIEKCVLEKALKYSKYNIAEVSRILGINRLTVIKKMKKHGLTEI